MDTASKVSIVIGSWGSYNVCNKRALGSKWLDLSEFSDWDQIVEELEKEGFELDGIDEELFIQDIEGINSSYGNWIAGIRRLCSIFWTKLACLTTATNTTR